MSNEKKASIGAALLSRHAEKIGLAVAAGALLVYFVAWGDAQDPAARKLKSDTDIVAKAEQAESHEEKQPKPLGDVQARALDPYKYVSPATPVENRWIVSYPTEWKVDVKSGPPPPKENPLAMLPLTLEIKELTFNQNILSWTVGTLEGVVAGGMQVKEVKPESFIIYRKVGAEDWKQIGTIVIQGDSLPTSFSDTQIAPKTVYKYRVNGASKDEKWVDRNGGEESKEGSNEIEVTSKDIFDYTISNPRPPKKGDDGDKGSVYVVIEKHDAAIDPTKPVKSSHAYAIGDRLGWYAETAGGPVVSVHSVSIGATKVDVDFNIGLTIKSIELAENLECLKCTQVDGECKLTKKKFSTNVIVLADGQGKEVIWYQKDPKTANEFTCEKHRPKASEEDAQKVVAQIDKALEDGKPRTAESKFEGELKKKYAETETYKKESKRIATAIAKGKDAIAQKLLDEAEKLYEDKRRDDAARKYEDLREDHFDTGVVKLNLQKIESRMDQERLAKLIWREAEGFYREKEYKKALGKFEDFKARFKRTEFFKDKSKILSDRIKDLKDRTQ